jgi:hypothetical protein
VEAARDAGVHLAFCSGNEVFWKVRWESSVDGTGTPHRTMVCYKETLENAKIDPRPEWTGTWRDPRFSPPTDGGRPENSLTGVLFRGQNGNPARAELAIQVPFAHAGQRLWRNTPVAALRPGETTILSPGTLGYEWDCDEDNGERPAGLIRLSETTVIAPMKLLDHGGTYGPASTTHRVTMYRAASGALVFAAGSIRWAWGLDETHPIAAPTDGSVQQAMVNLLADMGVQPATLLAGLVPASGPTDSTAPVSAVTWPAPGAAVTVGAPVSITGTAVDAAGRVAAVEVSVDGGATWHPAAGTGTWRYVFVPDRPGPIAVRSRAVDDSVNLETPGPGHTLQARARPYPVSIWTDNTVPAMSASNDEAAVEVGLKVRFEVPGFVTGLRYYRGAGSAGARTGRLWSAAGTVLGTCTFDGRTVDGWQQVAFSSPVAVGAGATYVASAYFPHGRYAADSAYFERSRGSYPVRALGDGEDGPNGVYRYGRGGRLPTDTFGATNYWVDVVFHGSESVPGVPPAGHHRGPAPDADVRTSNSEVVELRDPARSDGG